MEETPSLLFAQKLGEPVLFFPFLFFSFLILKNPFIAHYSPLSCVACSYKSDCCCSPSVFKPATFRKTVRRTFTRRTTRHFTSTTILLQTVTVTQSAALRRQRRHRLAGVGDLVEGTTGQRKSQELPPFVLAPNVGDEHPNESGDRLDKKTMERDNEVWDSANDEVETATAHHNSALFARHLCPTCPSGVLLLSSDQINYNSPVSYCCPARKTVTRTKTRSRTVVQTIRRSVVITSTRRITTTILQATSPQRLTVRLFWDVNSNGTWDYGVDLPYAGIVLQINSTGAAPVRQRVQGRQIMDEATTGANGTAIFSVSGVQPNEELEILFKSNASRLATVQAGPQGLLPKNEVLLIAGSGSLTTTSTMIAFIPTRTPSSRTASRTSTITIPTTTIPTTIIPTTTIPTTSISKSESTTVEPTLTKEVPATLTSSTTMSETSSTSFTETTSETTSLSETASDTVRSWACSQLKPSHDHIFELTI